jgi:hypothetical protein
MQFENALIAANRVDWSYSEKFGKQDAQIGTSYNIRRPIMTSVAVNNLAWTSANANVTETQINLALGTTLTTQMAFSDNDLAFKVEKFSDRFVKNAAIVMAAKMDSYIADACINANYAGQSVQTGAGWVVGSYGTAVNTATLLQAKQLLLDAACPDDGDIYGVLTPKAMAEISNAQITLFNAQAAISSIYKKGYIGEFAGVSFATSQSLTTHTNGGVSALAIGAGSAVLTAGWAESGVLTVTSVTGIKIGDVFTVAGVYAVNPLTKAVTSNLQQFTAIVDYPGATTVVAVSPAPITAGEYQNISTTVASKTASLVGAINTSGQESLMFHKKAIAVASPELALPKASSFDMAEFVKSDETELGLRFLRGYDMIGASGSVGFVSRLDTIFGVKIVSPSWIVRIRN